VNPHPSFSGVVTHISWGRETFIFHAFGVPILIGVFVASQLKKTCSAQLFVTWADSNMKPNISGADPTLLRARGKKKRLEVS